MIRLLERVALVSLLILIVTLGLRLFTLDYTQPQTEWGVSFDPYYAKSLGLNPPDVLTAALTDLGVNHLRLAARWDKLEPQRGEYDWSTLDWQLDAAREQNAQVLLALGRKLPRWPECYTPLWYDQLPASEQRAALLGFVQAVVERYRDNPAIVMWQVENEPLVGWFGICPSPSRQELKSEIALVHSLDSRPVMTTDSGELSAWLESGSSGVDILGTTLYRVVWNQHAGYIRWPLPPAYYTLKARLVQHLTGLPAVAISELQMEPWSTTGVLGLESLEEQYQSMSFEQFQDNLAFARRTGLSPVYLWGVEWWYWLREQHGVADFWNEARTLWQPEER